MFKLIRNTNDKVITAVMKANSDVYWQYLRDQLLLKESFDMSTLEPLTVYEDVKAFWDENTINVKVYYPRWRWSKAIGYFTPARPLDININGYKLNRSVDSIIGTLFHELVHMADNENEEHSYGHGDNNPNGKSNTSPYFIGNVFSNYNNSEMKTYTKHTPWYKRLFGWIF